MDWNRPDTASVRFPGQQVTTCTPGMGVHVILPHDDCLRVLHYLYAVSFGSSSAHSCVCCWPSHTSQTSVHVPCKELSLALEHELNCTCHRSKIYFKKENCEGNGLGQEVILGHVGRFLCDPSQDKLDLIVEVWGNVYGE